MYHAQDHTALNVNGLNSHMYKLNKIQGQIKMLEFEKLKLSRYLTEAESMATRNPKREADIARALRRVTENIDMWNRKLGAFATATQDKPSRPGPINGDQGGTLIG
jgi:hypothetical protein